MAESQKTLRMTFVTAAGTNVSISLASPKEGLSGAQIESVMDEIIAKDVFITDGGALVGKKDAKIINTQTEDLFDPA